MHRNALNRILELKKIRYYTRGPGDENNALIQLTGSEMATKVRLATTCLPPRTRVSK